MGQNKDPAVLFYTADFLASVCLMDMQERGQFITLLCLQKERGHLTMQEIQKVAQTPSDEVLSKFQQDEDGRYYNARMEQEIEARTAHRKKQKENIEKRWNKENEGVGTQVGITKHDTNGKDVGIGLVIPLGNGNGNINENISVSSLRQDKFEQFWKAYPKKVGKEAARKAFSRVKAPLESLLTAVERQKCGDQWTRENGRFIPNPATWLNQGRWEDEVNESPACGTGKPGYRAQGHHDELSELEREAVERLMSGE